MCFQQMRPLRFHQNNLLLGRQRLLQLRIASTTKSSRTRIPALITAHLHSPATGANSIVVTH